MKLFRLTATATALLALAGCASSTQNSSTPGQPGSSVVGSPPATGSAGGVPIPAPSDAEPLTVGGPVGVRVLSLAGPYEPAGPILAATVPGLLAQIRTSRSGTTPACPNIGCWAGAKVPAGSVLVAVRPALSACSHVQHVQSAKTAAGAIQLDLQLAGSCRPGAGSAARMPELLLALDSSALPASGAVSIEVRAAAPGTAMQTIGKATGTLPLTS